MICLNKRNMNYRKRKTTEEFVVESQQQHGIKKFNYGSVEYKTTQEKVKIFCNECQQYFFQLPLEHLKGRGCRNCGLNKVTILNFKPLTHQVFIEKAKQKHGNKYDYLNTVFVRIKDKVSIFCNKCQKDFVKQAGSHLQGGGCQICARAVPSKNKLTIEEFLIAAKKTHGEKYDYTNVIYINSVTKVKIFCLQCNILFEQRPNWHLRGEGCRSCQYKANTKNRTKSTQQFIDEAKVIHFDMYDYSQVVYISSMKKVIILCKQCNNTFHQIPSAHLRGQGCSNCIQSVMELKMINNVFIPLKIEIKRQKKIKTTDFFQQQELDFYQQFPHNIIGVEMDGKQHFQKCSFGSKNQEQISANFESQKIRDQRKNIWCFNNNVHLLRISNSVDPNTYMKIWQDFFLQSQQNTNKPLIVHIGKEYYDSDNKLFERYQTSISIPIITPITTIPITTAIITTITTTNN